MKDQTCWKNPDLISKKLRNWIQATYKLLRVYIEYKDICHLKICQIFLIKLIVKKKIHHKNNKSNNNSKYLNNNNNKNSHPLKNNNNNNHNNNKINNKILNNKLILKLLKI